MKTLHTVLLTAGLMASSEAFAAVPMMAQGVLATNGGANIEKTVVVVRRRAVVRRPVVVHRRVVR
jgi:hypothetical protein